MAKLLCLYCNDHFDTATASFRCANDSGLCPLELDEPLWRYRRLKPQMEQKVFQVKGGWRWLPNEAKCTCGFRTSTSVCPLCHNTLPGQFGRSKRFLVGMIGAKGSGKSNYIAALIHELENRVGANLDASLLPLDDATGPRYEAAYKKYLFEQQLVVPATQTGSGLYEFRYPLVYGLRKEAKRFGLGRRTVTTLAFFDAAGETLERLETTATEARYICNADALIFLIDPLQLPGVRQQLPQANLPPIYAESKRIINSAIRLIRTVNEVVDPARIKIPIAVVFSKADALRGLVESGSPLHTSSSETSYYDESDGERMHESMRSYLHRWSEASLDRDVLQNFKTFRYFAVSALGSSPDATGRLNRGVSPFRTEDPFLWAMSQAGVIAAKKRK